MKQIHTIPVIILLCFSVISLFSYGCEEKVLTCRWREREITIDGRDPEWGNFIQYYNQKHNVVLCMNNDENDLYLKVSTPDQMLQRQFLMLGFTVWFDPTGGKNKTLGIHFPKRIQSGAPAVLRPGRRNDRDSDVPVREKALRENSIFSDRMEKKAGHFQPTAQKSWGYRSISERQMESSSMNYKFLSLKMRSTIMPSELT